MIDAQSMENIENIDKHLKLAPLRWRGPGGGFLVALQHEVTFL